MDEKTSAFPIISERYKIINTIASGGMATIYRADDMVLDRFVAIKILKKELSKDSSFRSQFEVEAKASAKLSHPNIVATYDFGFFGERLFIAMELIEGNHLKNVIASTISFEQKLELLKQACKGLGYAHSKGIIHCDIKPQNMLIDKDGVLKLTDFGLSYALDTSSTKSGSEEVWGSPYYISPEIARGEAPTTASDVYSMGIVMYETLTGKLPFQGSDALEIIEQHQIRSPEKPSTIIPEFPVAIEAIIMKAISKKSEKRYKDGNAIFLALSKIDLSEQPQAIPSPSIPQQTADNSDLPEEKIQPDENKFDWVTILLSLLAVLTVGGLIPFWLFVYYSINR